MEHSGSRREVRRSFQTKRNVILPEEHADSSLQRLLRWLITEPVQRDGALPITRNFQVWNSDRMIFVFGGRFRITKGKPISILSFLAIVIPCVLFCVFEASWCWHNISPAAVMMFFYCWGITIASFIKASTSDPGVIPNNIHLTEDPYNIPEDYFNTITLPGYDDKHSVEVKYCTTCRNWRMPRTFHCSKCDQCISIHDHHCVYINNCVGERNYRYFYCFLLFACLSCIFFTTLSLYHLLEYKRKYGYVIREALKHVPMSLFNGIYGLLAILYPLLLLCAHTYLIASRQTTREFLRKMHSINSGPYSFKNVWKNILSTLCKPRGYSYISARGKYQGNDHRFERFPQATGFSK